MEILHEILEEIHCSFNIKFSPNGVFVSPFLKICNKSIIKSPKLATVARRNKDNRVSLYNVASIHHGGQEADNLLQYNIYDATPDHSILKHGMAKSLSNFHLGTHFRLFYWDNCTLFTFEL